MREYVVSAPVRLLNWLLVQLVAIIALTGNGLAQVYTPIFKSVEMQATIGPLGEMVQGFFFGHRSIAVISKSEKAIYFFEPDSMENLILTNVVSLPDTPIAISKGKGVVISSGDHGDMPDKLVVLMKPHKVALVSFGVDGQPEVSPTIPVDPYSTGVRAVDLETTGKLDLIAFGKFSLGISVEKNTGGGRFVQIQPMPGSLGNLPFNDIAFTDFNGDLVPDLAGLDWVNRRLLIFYGRGDGTFAQPVSFPLKAEPATLAVADLSGNGYPDIVVGYTRLPEIDIFGGDGFGRFFLRQSIKTAAPVSKFAIADYTGDGAMDIAALSGTTKEIMLFAYDPLSRRFQYSGVIGLGDNYDDIIPFYFSNRIRADLVATSPKENFVKVFKSAVTFGKLSDMFVPACSHPDFLAVTGSDTANFLVTGNAAGKFMATFSNSTGVTDARSAVDWRTKVTPAILQLVSDNSPDILVSYENVTDLSLYEVQSGANGIAELNAETAFLPFAARCEVEGDSASVAVAFRGRPDSAVGVSVFSTVKGRTDFLEHDYSVIDTEAYVCSALTFSPTLSFLRIWRLSADTLQLACTSLRPAGTSLMDIRASNARFLSIPGSADLVLALQENDSLSLFTVRPETMGRLSLDSICSVLFDSLNFSTVKLASRDSILYMTYVNRVDKSVFLYHLGNERLRFVRAWHVSNAPADIAISPFIRTIYFLDSTEAYVSIHNF